MVFGILLKLIDVMYLILIYSCPFNHQGSDPCLYDCDIKKKQKQKNKKTKNKAKNTIDLYSDINVPISFKFGMMIETTTLYILTGFWMTLTLIQGHSYM